jgi:hypothetical protein
MEDQARLDKSTLCTENFPNWAYDLIPTTSTIATTVILPVLHSNSLSALANGISVNTGLQRLQNPTVC